MAQMEAMVQELGNETLTLQQQQEQETLQKTTTTGLGQTVQMERLIGMLIDHAPVLSERSRVNLVDVTGICKPNVFHKR